MWEWTSYVISDNSDKPSGSGESATSEYNTVDGTVSMAKSELISNPWTSAQGSGMYIRGNQSIAGALRRGGSWYNGAHAGVFAARLDAHSSSLSPPQGFRCVRP